MDISKALDELRKLVPPENFSLEPDTSYAELLKYEKTFGISTSDFLNNTVNRNTIPLDVQEEWWNSAETFLLFGGKVEENGLVFPNKKLEESDE